MRTLDDVSNNRSQSVDQSNRCRLFFQEFDSGPFQTGRADYSTTTEIADALLQKADVPFRTGHHFASQLTDYGRGKGMKLHEIPFAEVQRIYAENANAALPLGEKEYADIISAEYMVFGRKGLGGPQSDDTRRMLANSNSAVQLDKSRRKNKNIAISDGLKILMRSFVTTQR